MVTCPKEHKTALHRIQSYDSRASGSRDAVISLCVKTAFEETKSLISPPRDLAIYLMNEWSNNHSIEDLKGRGENQNATSHKNNSNNNVNNKNTNVSNSGYNLMSAYSLLSDSKHWLYVLLFNLSQVEWSKEYYLRFTNEHTGLTTFRRALRVTQVVRWGATPQFRVRPHVLRSWLSYRTVITMQHHGVERGLRGSAILTQSTYATSEMLLHSGLQSS